MAWHTIIKIGLSARGPSEMRCSENAEEPKEPQGLGRQVPRVAVACKQWSEAVARVSHQVQQLHIFRPGGLYILRNRCGPHPALTFFAGPRMRLNKACAPHLHR